ncbi:MAG: DNA mismatch repair protein MutS [Vicinamibacteria bacterium]
MATDALSTYTARLEVRKAERAQHERRDRSLSRTRMVVAGAGVLTALVFPLRLPTFVALAAAALAFVVLVVVHERLARRLARARRRVAFLETAIARTNGDWIGRGDPGAAFADPAHPYAADLDLFGRGSLFERLSTARTHAGQERLASWLLRPSPVAVVRARQAAAAELGPRLDLREDLAVLGAEAKGAVDSRSLARWATAEPVPMPRGLRGAALAATCAAALALVAWSSGLAGIQPFYLATAAVALCTLYGRAFAQRVLEGIGRPAQDLQTLTEIFDRLAAERFEAPRLAELHASLAQGDAPGPAIAQLRRWLEIHESRANAFFGLIAFFMVWDAQLAAEVEAWRRRYGGPIVGWLAALGEMEALVSLGTCAFENPDDPFPELDDSGPLFDAQALGHPLLARSRAVCNDVRLDADRQMLVITGSNMSGKSTFLRTVGTNTVLALAGAPVRARALRLSPLSVGASIRVTDSLQDGESRFYAEIKRVRQVLDLARDEAPALFLMDEIFDGTNSAERRVGAEAVVRSLLGRGAIGLVTSHDLALAEIAVSLAPRAENVHFEDHLEGERIAFDYRLKPGPVQRGNALGLMRAVGLEV